MRGPGHAPTNGTRGPARRLPGQGVVLEPRAHGRAGPHLDIGQVARRPGSASLMSRKVPVGLNRFVFFMTLYRVISYMSLVMQHVHVQCHVIDIVIIKLNR